MMTTAAHAQETSRAFRIPAQPLGAALVLFSEQSGMAVMAPAELVRDKTAPAVEGSITPSAAVDRLLKGSGLKYSRSADGAFLIAEAPRQAAGKPVAPKVATEIEEITVTAQRREESLQETPISVTALTSASLEQRNIESMADIGTSVPGLRMQETTRGANSVQITIRGLTQINGETSFQGKVGLYIDGAYIAQLQGSNFDLEDLERVEMLRGPQGTLFGRNTIAGAVNFITKKPTEERSITLNSEVGNYDTFYTRLKFNLPVIGKNGFFQSDALGTLSIRENVGYKSRDNLYSNGLTSSMPASPPVSGGSGYNNQSRIFNFTSVRWQPNKDITVDFMSEWHRFKTRSLAWELTYVYPGSLPSFTQIPVPGFGLVPNPFYSIPYIQKNRSDVVPGHALAPGDEAPGTTTLNHDQSNEHLDVLTAAWNLGQLGSLGDVTLKSISEYRSLYNNWAQIIDGTPFTIFDSPGANSINHWSEELQWIGTAKRVRYVGGLYYYGEHDMNNYKQNVFNQIRIPYRNFNHLKSYAAYGQMTWTPPILRDKLSLTAGLRITREQVHLTHMWAKAMSPYATVPGLKMEGGRPFGGFEGAAAPGISPMADVSYQWTEDFMTYARVSRGFSGGGFNPSTNGDPRQFKSYKPEWQLSYEAGIKSQWLDNRLRVNADGFFSQYRDMQETIYTPVPGGAPLSIPGNADRAELWGTEAEVTVIPFRGLEANASYSFLAPKYTKWIDQRVDALGNPAFDAAGNPIRGSVVDQRSFPTMPQHQISGGLTYTAPPTTTGIFSAHIEANWQDKVIWSANNTSPGYQATEGWAYALVNGRVTFADIPLQKGTLDLSVWSKNILDRKYRVYGVDFGSGIGIAGAQYGDPRTFGLSLTYNFSES